MDLSVEEYLAVRRLNYVCVHLHVSKRETVKGSQEKYITNLCIPCKKPSYNFIYI